MKTIRNSQGKINIQGTLSTMNVGDTLVLKENEVKVSYVRTLACTIGRENRWNLEVANSKELKGKIIVKRKN